MYEYNCHAPSSLKCSCCKMLLLAVPKLISVLSSLTPKHTTASYTIKILLSWLCSHGCVSTLDEITSIYQKGCLAGRRYV